MTVVLPCLNEIASVALCVKDGLTALQQAGYAGEVIVVDNGSRDGSAEAATAAGARVIHEPRPGYGSAVLTGIAGARGDIIVMADADWTYDLTKLSLLVEPIAACRADLVLGSRLSAAPRRSMPLLHRYIGTPMLTFLVRLVGAGGTVTDSQSGFRAFRAADIRALGLRAPGMELTSEMLIRAGQEGLRVADVPTGYRERIGLSKMRTFADGGRNLSVISRVAPQLMLACGGALLFLFGLSVTLASLIAPDGIVVGSLRWQPVFFAGIALTLGLEACITGLVLAQLGTRGREGRPGLSFVASKHFVRGCIIGGMVAMVLGACLDGYLIAIWLAGRTSPRGLALASLAQNLLVVGGSIASVGALAHVVRGREISPPHTLVDQPPPDHTPVGAETESLVRGD